MFLQRPAKSEDGAAKPKKAKGGGLPFSNYIGEDAAKELMSGVKADIASMEEDVADFKGMADEIIKVSLKETPMVQAFRGLIFQDEEVPEPQVPEETPADSDPVVVPETPEPEAPPVEDDVTDQWPLPIPKEPPMPPILPPRIPPNIPQQPMPRPPVPKPPVPWPPMPRPPVPWPIPPITPTPKVPVPPTPPVAPPEPVPEDGSGGASNEDMANLLKALEALTAGLDAMGQNIVDKVNILEDAVKSRSDEIREDVKNIHQDAVDFSKKIKAAMHDAELKDLEIQERTMKILDAAEDRAIERALKTQGLFGNR